MTLLPIGKTSLSPTEGSIISLSTCRPPPSCTTLRPNASLSHAVIYPSRAAYISRITGASGKNRCQFSTKPRGPPISAIIWPNFSAACPLSSRFAKSSCAASKDLKSRLAHKSSPPNCSVNSRNRPALPSHSTCITSTNSSALPKAGAKGWFISLISAIVLHPAWPAVRTSDCARTRAWSGVFINAPLPHFTSKISPSNPAANFFDKIDAVIRSRLSTVEVTSRMA